jgi:hypothetical protein
MSQGRTTASWQHLTICPGTNPRPSNRVHEGQDLVDARDCPRPYSPPLQVRLRG